MAKWAKGAKIRVLGRTATFIFQLATLDAKLTHPGTGLGLGDLDAEPLLGAPQGAICDAGLLGEFLYH
jgi:hypothetical protein